MTLFNITNAKNFFNTLTKTCKGDVEIVDENGMHLSLLEHGKTSDLLPMTYYDGNISRIELCFRCRDDAHRMIRQMQGGFCGI